MQYTPLQQGATPTLGTSGDAVKALQTQLNTQNAGVAGYVPLKVDGLYGPLTQAAVNYKNPNVSTQSTTTLVSDKTKDIANNNKNLTDLSNKGVTTDPNTGLATTADGKAYTPAVADTSTEDAKINDYYNQMTSTLDAQTKSTLDNIKTKFDALRAEQRDINDRQQKGVQTALLTGGVTGQGSSAQYAPISSEGIMGSQMSYGLKQIANLDAQENDLINAAKQAQSAGNMRIMEMKLAEVEKTREAKLAAAAELNKKIAEQQAKLQEQNMQMEKDSSIADLYQSGVTSTSDILKQLKSQGITATAKDVSDALKNTGVEDINKLMSEASKNGAPLSVIQKIGQAKSVAEATLAAGEYTGDVLDRQYKKAQIAKIYKDMQDSGIGGQDASSLVAYAQQYASTGNIPTGLPKGTFGVVAQVAKELPKQKGELVSSNTGIKSTSVGTVEQNDLTKLYNIIQDVKKLKELDQQRVGGIVAGTIGKITGSDAQAKYLTTRKSIVDNISRMQSGAALTPDEVSFYEDYLPGRFSETLGFGQDSLKKINNFETVMNNKLQNALSTNGLSIYGYSKVNLGGKEYTVGDTIEVNGVHGRVNPDGSVTKI